MSASNPFIIAEVGSNWLTFQDCIDSIVKAKHAWADAVKFQLFDDLSLFGMRRKPDEWQANYQAVIIGGKEYAAEPHAVPSEWLPKLKEKADACGIEFMCTAFSPELYDVVNPFVSRHKIASAEACHIRILEKVNNYGKPVILSTGAKGELDIEAALSVLKDVEVTLMYCVAAYPASEVNLDALDVLRTRFGTPVGYSDHTTDVAVIPRLAAQLGATVIEKHFTCVDADTPDRPHSLDPEQFRRMATCIRSHVPFAIGPTLAEKDMVLRHNRRLIATRDIEPGDMLMEGGNFGIYRSLKDDTHAFHPFMLPRITGLLAKRAIQAGGGIGPGDV